MSSRLKPWYTVVEPRQDLLQGKALDTAEFAVHLDHVRDGNAHADYQDPKRFFEKTFLTQNLTELASQMVRRLNGETEGTSAVFNLSTQFGGGKTHSLTLLYHLVRNGPEAHGWTGVDRILTAAGKSSIPKGEAAIFVGTEFDSIAGRGGDDGTPLRRTPWGEIAWQLGGEESFKHVRQHDEQGTAPGGDVIRKILPADKPCLILLDELMNYVSRFRKSGLSAQLYQFLQNLSETIRGRANALLVVSIPASELEMTAEDIEDFNRLSKLLDRLGKALVMSAETETSEIIRRRLFDGWDLRALGADGRVALDRDALATCRLYADWVIQYKDLLPGWFSPDQAEKAFQATYPFHPSVISVFERKWRSVNSFQQTRGVLRMLGLWVAKAMASGIKSSRDPLITLGTAPLENSDFRTACFEQLGARELEPVITTDVAGSAHSHSVRLDNEANDEIRKLRLHQKISTAVFFESNGGRVREKAATVPEIRLAIGSPEQDNEIGNIETALDALSDACYYMTVERNTYRFGHQENLNKRFSDRRASIQRADIDHLLTKEIQKLFGKNTLKLSPYFFPDRSNQVPDRPALTIVVAGFNRTMEDSKETMAFIESVVRESGTSSRTFKSAQLWIVADSVKTMRSEATRYLAWQDIDNESSQLGYDEIQLKQLAKNLKTAENDLREAIWRAYRHVILLGKDNSLDMIDLGLVTSSGASSPVDQVIQRLQQEDRVQKGISPQFLVRNWPPAFKEWSTKDVRDAMFASPAFPLLLDPDQIRETIARAVTNGVVGLVGKRGDGHYDPFIFERAITSLDVDVSEDFFVITKATAEAYRDAIEAAAATGGETDVPSGSPGTPTPNPTVIPSTTRKPEPKPETEQGDFFQSLTWSGEVPAQKWMNFYTKVLAKHASDPGLKLKVSFESAPASGVSAAKAQETKTALRELGLDADALKNRT
jgi:hypothetical protein